MRMPKGDAELTTQRHPSGSRLHPQDNDFTIRHKGMDLCWGCMDESALHKLRPHSEFRDFMAEFWETREWHDPNIEVPPELADAAREAVIGWWSARNFVIEAEREWFMEVMPHYPELVVSLYKKGVFWMDAHYEIVELINRKYGEAK